MEILTVLDELYHVNPEDEARLMEQISLHLPYLFFRDGRKAICLVASNIVSIEYLGEWK